MSTLSIEEGILRGGRVCLAGYKHTAVPILSAIIGLGLRTRLRNVPRVEDTRFLRSFIEESGGSVEGDFQWTVDARRMRSAKLSPTLTRGVHGSLYLVPALLGRFSEIRFPGAGGCQIGGGGGGARPVGHVTDVLRQFGARFEVSGNTIAGEVDEFRACEIDILQYSDDPRVPNGPLVSGATKTAILAAALCRNGTTRILNPYPKVDVTDLLLFLESSRCCRVVRGWGSISIIPCGADRSNGGAFELVDDISEFITFAGLAVLHGVPIVARVRHGARLTRALAPELEALRRLGVVVRERPGEFEVLPPRRVSSADLEAASVGLYSDHQPFFALMLLRGDREAYLTDRVWAGRYAYAAGLAELGGDVAVEGDRLRIRPSRLTRIGRHLRGCDTRSSAALVVAGLGLPGTELEDAAVHIDRGYDGLVAKLRGLGAEIVCRPDEGRGETIPARQARAG